MTSSGPLERMTPSESPNESWLAVHVARYDFAFRYARQSGRLLDIACGSGHGTALLAERLPHTECVGVDLDQEAITRATAGYALANISFVCADGMTFFEPEPFDTIVSLETIEHLDDAAAFVERLARMLKPHGRLIASVPSTPSTDANPYHRQDFTEASFQRLFTRHGMREVASLRIVDPFRNTPAFAQAGVDRLAIFKRMLRHYATHPSSFVKRLGATVRYGLENRYITTAWEKASG